jgi:predicted transcriptional regulator
MKFFDRLLKRRNVNIFLSINNKKTLMELAKEHKANYGAYANLWDRLKQWQQLGLITKNKKKDPYLLTEKGKLFQDQLRQIVSVI